MSLNGILGAATSGLLASQTGLRTVSDNIANINTPGYVRRVVDLQSSSMAEMGGGVQVAGVRRVVDQFLQQASLSASADAAAAAALSEVLDRAQVLFGDPSADSGFFNQLDRVWQAFSTASLDPTSSVGRSQALTAITDFLDRAAGLSASIGELKVEASDKISSGLEEVNRLLVQIDELNTAITRATATGQDPSGAQNAQSTLIDRLSKLMDISLSDGGNGRVSIRAGQGGVLIVGENGPARIGYVQSGSAPGWLTATSGTTAPQTLAVAGGELGGLLDLANGGLDDLSAGLNEYVSRAVEEINRAHNAASASPAPASLTGRDTGLDIASAIAGFSGKTTVNIVGADGVSVRKVTIDFDANTMAVGAGGPVAFTASTFMMRLNSALGVDGSASFTNGALSISASGAAGRGVAVTDVAATPSLKAGRSFSHFFGLNDLVTTTGFPNPATGLSTSSAHGFNAGGQIDFQLYGPDGAPLRTVSVGVPAGATMANLLTALNSTTTGVGLYGAFSLDAQGRMSFAANSTGATIAVVNDTTQRGASGPSMSELFGLDPRFTNNRAGSFSLRSDIVANPQKLALAQYDPTVAAGVSGLLAGDNRGALLLAAAGQASAGFNAAGDLTAMTATLSQYAAQLSGSIGQKSSAAADRAEGAAAVAAEASGRRASMEGVNLDEELIQLTTYQQSYNASARLIQAVKDMYDVLLNMA